MSAPLVHLLRVAPPARSDRDLLRAQLAGTDPAAIDELVRRYAGLARRAAEEVCPAAADDVTQTTLDLLVRKAAAIAGRESAAGWVFETARRLALKARTAAARRAAHEGRANPPPPPPDPLDVLTLREIRAVVAEELARLPDELRLPLVLCYWDGAARPTAAARLGCSVSTLKRRLDAGRDQLAARLARRGFAGPAVLAALTAVQAGAEAAAPVVLGAVGRGVARWKLLAAVVLAAGVAAAGVGVEMAAPGAADPPARPAGSAAPPSTAAGPGPAVDQSGDPLPAGAVARFGTVRFRHGGEVQSIAYSPDGKMIASGGFDRIMLWEAATGKPLAQLVRTVELSPGPGKPPGRQVEIGHTPGLAFTPDGKQLIAVRSLVAGEVRHQVVFWDVSVPGPGPTPKVCDVTHGSVVAVAVAPGGKTAAVGTYSGVLQLVDVDTQAVRTTANTGRRAMTGLSFAPDGAVLAVATEQGVLLLDPATGKETARLEAGRARQVVFAPDRKSVWVGSDGGEPPNDDKTPGTISRWDLRTRTAVQTFKTAPGRFLSLALSPDGKILASGGQKNGPVLWDVGTGTAVDLAPPGRRIRPWVNGLAFAPDGKTLAVADTTGRVQVWEVATRRELLRRDGHTDGVVRVGLSPDGTRAATAGGDGTVRIWDMSTGRPVRSWTADEEHYIVTAAYTPDGGSVLTAGWDGTVRLWDAATGREVRRFRDGKGFARAALSPDGRLVAASGKDSRSIVLYETGTGRPVRELTGHVSLVMSLAFSADGRQLVSMADMHVGKGGQGFDDRSVRVWDVATGRELHKFDAGRPQSAAVSPDNRVVVAYGIQNDPERTGYLRFWDTKTGAEIADRRVKAGTRDLWAIAFSPDGRYLATGDGADVQLVELASGQPVRVFASGGGMVYGLAFARDGRRVVSAHDDGTALVWDLTPRPAAGASPGRLWDDLGAADAAVAYRAATALVADPAAAVGLLGEKLRPVPKPAGVRPTAALIADLGDPAFEVRGAASRELARRVGVDDAELDAALAKTSSAEVRQRLGEVFRASPGPWPTPTAENLRRVRALAVLEAVGTPEARRLLRILADGDPYAPLTREARTVSRRLGG